MHANDLDRQLGALRFTLADVVRFSNVGAETVSTKRLRDLIEAGLITPAVLGGKGKGNGHRLDLGQLIGVSAAIHLWLSPRGCRWEYLAETVREFESWTWQAVRQLLRLRHDCYTEEAVAQQIHDCMEPAEFDAFEYYRHPEDKERGPLLVKRLLRIRAAVVARLQLERRQHNTGRMRGRAATAVI
jgi:hypothetical protein